MNNENDEAVDTKVVVRDAQEDTDIQSNISSKLRDDSRGSFTSRLSAESAKSAADHLPSMTLYENAPFEMKETNDAHDESKSTDNSSKDSSDASKDASDSSKESDKREKETLDGLRELMDKKAAEDTFAGAVIVAKDGVPIFAETRGLADRETGEPNTLDTKFRIASMGKMFTAVSTMKLVEDGKINLDDTLDKYLPDYPNNDVASKVTIRQLLNHTSGLGDIFTDEYYKDPSKFKETADYIKANADNPLGAEPGTKFAYSNYGYVLLGAIIEKASGQPYESFLKEKIFDPLGMKDTGMRPEHEHVEGRSKGYTSETQAKDEASAGPPYKSNEDTLPYKPTSAGGSYSTANDLLKFANALKDNKLISEETKKLMITPTQKDNPFAYGSIERENNDGEKSYGHAGGAEGMSSDLQIFEKSGYAVISLSNLDPPAAIWMSEYASKRLPSRK
jgi:CubicO group peptidase (beta-lactamase class C family)